MSKPNFNNEAQHYDKNFTFSTIGKAQRELVFNYLDEVIKTEKKILEINCGTGEDALKLSKSNHNIIATDISESMVGVAKRKLKDHENKITVETLDVNNLSNYRTSERFDLIFSNFGGLNCLSKNEFQTFLNSAVKKLNKKGQLIMVIMPKHCIWDNVYLFLKGKWNALFRRNTKTYLEVNVADAIIKTWYYNPKDIINFKPDAFKVKAIKPVGLFIPPSYLESFFSTKPKVFKVLKTLERSISNKQKVAKFSDHYLINLQLV